MTFSLHNSTQGAGPGPCKDMRTCDGSYFDGSVPKKECKGFNEGILEEKEGFDNSLVPKHPAQLS